MKKILLITAIVAGFATFLEWLPVTVALPIIYISLGCFMAVRMVEAWRERNKLASALDFLAAVLMAVLCMAFVMKHFF